MSSSSTDQPNDNPKIVDKLQSADNLNLDINTPTSADNQSEILANVQELDQDLASGDDYYLNPLVNTNLSEKIDKDDTLDKMIESLEGDTSVLNSSSKEDDSKTSQSPITSKEVLNALGIGTGVSGISNYVGDPYVDPQGRTVKNATFLGTLIEIPQNQGMNGYQDYYEEGRLVSFSITCNDPDMIPIVFIENTSGSRNVINDLSYREAVTLGRGMTLGEALSTTYLKDTGKTSRDISGQRHLVFPYVARFKNTFTGVETDYSKIKGTVDDKYYVMNYEPMEYIPYRRLYIDVFNGSQDGNRMVHRIEVKRLIYEDPNLSSGKVGETELTDMNRELNVLKDRFDEKESHTLEDLEPIDIDKISEVPSTQSNLAITNKPVDWVKEFVGFLYHKMNPTDNKKKDETVISFNAKKKKNEMRVVNSKTTKKNNRRKDSDNSTMSVEMF